MVYERGEEPDEEEEEEREGEGEKGEEGEGEERRVMRHVHRIAPSSSER